MSACERCWADAYTRMHTRQDGRSQYEHYVDLLNERRNHPCTEDEQRGERADADRREGR